MIVSRRFNRKFMRRLTLHKAVTTCLLAALLAGLIPPPVVYSVLPSPAAALADTLLPDLPAAQAAAEPVMAITADQPVEAAAAAPAANVVASAVPGGTTSTQITGNVFRDFNSDGLKSTGSITDTGVSGVTVTAYAATGAQAGVATTDSNGDYTITGLTAGVAYRIEFSTLPTGYYPTTHGNGVGDTNGTTVQFAAAGTSQVSLGVNYPADYSQHDPLIIGSRYIFSDTDSYPSVVAILSNPYNTTQADGTKRPTEFSSVTYSQVGNTWGRTYKRDSKEVFTSAISHRGLALGPGGAGAIYKISGMTTSGAQSASVFATIPNVGTVASNAARLLQNMPQVLDTQMYTDSGKIGLGGLTISDDWTTLYAMNLNDRSIYPVDATSGAVGTPIALSDPGCGASPYRPWALKYYQGDLYAGIVCENASNAYVVKLAGPSFATQNVVSTTPLNYAREIVYNAGTCSNAGMSTWKAWTDAAPIPSICYASNSAIVYPTPLLVSLEFADNGDLLLGLNDRTTMQLGWFMPSPFGTVNGTPLKTMAGGDILKAAKGGNTWGAGSPTPYEMADNIEDGVNSFPHRETALGGLAVRTGSAEFVLTAFDPIDDVNKNYDIYDAAGVKVIGQTSGSVNRHYFQYGATYEAVAGTTAETPYVFGGKGGGLGDIELLLDPAPLEIGNRVWLDDNHNGIQDPGEDFISSVTVLLTDGNGNSYTAVTNAQGEYYFNSSNVSGGLQSNTAYTLTIDTTQSVLTGYALAPANVVTTSTTIADGVDSDAILDGTLATILLTTGNAGANDHSYDFGFHDAALSLGNRLFYDTNNDGLDNDGAGGSLGSGISGVTVQLLDHNNVVTATTTTDANGYYRFDDLTGGATYTVLIPASNFASGSKLHGYQNSTPTANDAIDANDNGSVTGTLGSGGDVRSAAITLVEGALPLGETAMGGGTNAPDGDRHDDLTIDFGFYHLTLGNRVWYDDNRDGSDGAEIGAAGIPVTLTTGSGVVVATTTTDGSGYYTFTNLISDTYIVQIQAPTNYLSSATDDATTNTDLNDNGQGNSGGLISSQVVALTPGSNGGAIVVESTHGHTHNLTIDFGIYLPKADLQVLKSVEPPTYTIGVATQVTFTIVITNYGPAAVVNAPVTDTQPVSITFDSWICTVNGVGSCGAASGSGDINSTVTLNAGSAATWIITATIDTTAEDPIINTAREALPANLAQDTVNRTDSTAVSVLPEQPLFSVGNRVWFDTNDDGASSGPGVAEPVPQVLLQLVYSGTTTALQTIQTGVNGYYRFDNVPAGDYQIVVAASNFQVGGVLAGYHNSSFYTTTLAGDNHDHAPNVTPSIAATGVRSVPFSLGLGLQPTGETAVGGGDDGPHGDANSNLTIDFGFNKQHVGNQLWYDTDNDGVYEPGDGELPLPAGVVVVLHAVVGVVDTPFLTTTTDLNGQYNFAADNNLDLDPINNPFQIYIAIPAGQAALNSYLPSTGVRHEGGGVDNENVGAIDATGVVTSGLFYPLPGSTANGALVFDDLGETYQPTLDFGFVQETFTLGNRVWYDTDNDGFFDPTEQPVAGVIVELLDSSDNYITETTTNASGYYSFTGLTAGSYLVEVTGRNFLSGAPLYGYQNSTPTTTTTTLADDSHDHGLNVVNGRPGVDGVISDLITLGSGLQPTGESDGAHGPEGDANDNLTVDFGFYKLVLGNQTWDDEDNNGHYEPAINTTLVVNVRLYAADGTTEILVGPDGVFGTADDVTGGVTTGTNGRYAFSGLTPGDYIVKVKTPNGHVSSTGSGSPLIAGVYEPAADPDDNLDEDDNGSDGSGADAGWLVSLPVTLTPGAAGAEGNNVVDNAVGSTTDPTVDFGYVHLVSLGNIIWDDRNNNGRYDSATESGIDGVLVNLYYDANGDGDVTDAGETTPLTTTTTAGGGLYLFANLLAGNYLVELDAANFTTGSVLENYTSSTGQNGSVTGPYETAPDPDASGVDNDDNGTIQGTLGSGGVIRSAVVTLDEGGEPTGENPDNDTVTPDPNENLTVDFGLFLYAELGNYTWLDDANKDGIQDSSEAPLAGVTVQLYTTSDQLVASTFTGLTGYYTFTNLLPGDYYVKFTPPAGYAVTQQDQGGDTLDSDADPVTGQTITTTLVLDERDYTWDAGFLPTRFGDRVWIESDNDGLANTPGTTNIPVEGMVITATASSGDVYTTTTNAAGYYSFTVVADTYTVTYGSVPPAYGVVVPSATPGGSSASGNAGSYAESGNPDQSHAQETLVTVATGETNWHVDFAFSAPRVSLGNRLFYDTDDDGQDNDGVGSALGSSVGIDGATVQLYRDTNGNGSFDAGDAFVTDIQTSNGGYYTFTNLMPTTGITSTYLVVITSSNFIAGGPLAGYWSSTDIPTTLTPDGDVDFDDNGETMGVLGQLNGIVASRALTLTVNGEPTGENNGGNDPTADDSSNQTVDFGFYLTDLGDAPDSYSTTLNNTTPYTGASHIISDTLYLGSRVDAEADGQPVADGAAATNDDDTAAAANVGGVGDDEDGIFFVNSLIAGQIVTVEVTVTGDGGYLSGWLDFGADGAWTQARDQIFDGVAVSNGLNVLTFTVPLTASTNITTYARFRLSTEADLNFYDAAGPAPDGEVEDYDVLIEKFDLALVKTVAATSDTPLLPGSSVVTFTVTVTNQGNIAATDIVVVDYLPTGLTFNAAKNPGWSNGTPLAYTLAGPLAPGAGTAVTLVLDVALTASGTLTNAAEISAAVDSLGQPVVDVDSTPDNNSGNDGPVTDNEVNNTNDDEDDHDIAEIGIGELVALGNLIWQDTNNDGDFDASEEPIPGVTVTLYLSDSVAGVDLPIATTQTDGDGRYIFDNLAPGQYFVHLPAVNFTGAGALVGFRSSDGAGSSELSDQTVDENGQDTLVAGGIRSMVYDLQPNSEPVALDDDTGYPGILDDDNVNLTADFAFWQPAALGDYVWVDTNRNGTQDEVTGRNGVTVTLFYSNPVSGLWVQRAVTTTTNHPITNNPGYYTFTNLISGTYYVSFTLPSDYRFTTPDAAGSTEVTDSDANVVTGATTPITLNAGEQNPHVDAGLWQPLSLGNRVWLDEGAGLFHNNGQDDGETGIENVVLQLLNGDGSAYDRDPLTAGTQIYTATTNDTGYYSFTNLISGAYRVQVVASNFTAGNPLAAHVSSDDPATGANPDNNTDLDDNGPGTSSGVVTSGVITLTDGAEPITDGDSDANTNLTVDFGFFIPVSLGNRLFYDTDDDGLDNDGAGRALGSSAGIDGATVQLYRDTNGNGSFDAGDAFVRTTTTQNGGYYTFTNLTPTISPTSAYLVVITSTNFITGGPMAGYWSSSDIPTSLNPDGDVDFDDNGETSGVLGQLNGMVASRALTLTVNGEPTGENNGGNDSTDDNDSNQTVDFGFYRYDWGDLPAGATGSPTYPTLSVDDGARHFIDPLANPILGATVDSEYDGQPTNGAGGDDLAVSDDEDGVQIPLLYPSTTVNITVTYSNPTTGTAYLNAWIDFNHDGDMNDAGEQIATDEVVPTGNGQLVLAVAVPATAQPGDVYARFRISSDQGLTMTGVAPNGEVEDYLALVPPVDLGDLPDQYGTIKSSDGARHPIISGTRLDGRVDSDPDGMPGNGANGDDNDSDGIADGDDEDGVQWPPVIAPNSTVPVTVTVVTTGTAYLNAWIDWNGDGDFADNLERIVVTDTAYATGTHVVNISVPSFVTDTLYARFRIADNPDEASEPTGSAQSGEVEDYVLMGLGNTVWLDNGQGGGVADNGILDGHEQGISGVTVELYRSGDTPGVDAPIGTTTTDQDGHYHFAGLQPGDYVVHIPATNFNETTDPLYAHLSSTGAGLPNADADETVDENGIDDSNPAANGISSAVVTLTINGEPINDGDGANGNQTLDFGFVAYDLGDLPDGPYNTLLANGGAHHVVSSDLYFGSLVDDEPDGQPSANADGDDTNSDDEDGIVFMDALMPNTSATISMTAYVTPGLTAYYGAFIDFNGDGAFDDSEIFTGTLADGVNTLDITVPGVVSDTVYSRFRIATDLAEVSQPDGVALSGEVEDYVLMSLGNQLWYDTDNSGTYDGGELPIPAGVTLTLVNGTGTVIATTTTDSNGQYLFTGLMPGDYQVIVDAGNFQGGGRLEHYLGSTGQDTGDAIDDNDNGDNPAAALVEANGVRSTVVTLALGTEPTTDTNGANSNLSVDFGFYQLILGNRIWEDLNNNGQDDNEPDLNVTLMITATNLTTGDVYTTPTDLNGYYTFTGIVSGTYVVSFDAPAGYVSSSTDGSPNAADLDDNGLGNSGGLISSAPFTVTPGVTISGVQTATQSSGTTTNPSVDFGLWQPLSLGNRVWLDEGAGLFHNNGQDDSETGIKDVVLQLLNSDGTAYDRDPLTAGTQIYTATTNDTGYYSFTNLISGAYRVQVVASNFTAGKPLAGLVSSHDPATGATPDHNTDLDDNGPGTSSGVVTSGVITLTYGAEPITDGDSDANTNWTVDFGFVTPVNLGNYVWVDSDGSGIQDEPSSAGLDGVTVTLTTPTGVVITTTTRDGGYYTFTNLLPNTTYTVTFTPPCPPTGCYHFTTPNSSGSTDASDSDAPTSGPNRGVVVVTTGITDDLTIDAGLVQPLSLGNRVWLDEGAGLFHNNGQDDSETGIQDVVLQLLNGDGTAYDRDPLTVGTQIYTATTNDTGYYSFTNLISGAYRVQVVASNFTAGKPLAGLVSSADPATGATPDNNTDLDDNGPGTSSGVVTSGVITLTYGAEPDGSPDVDGDSDANTNWTVDFGFVTPVNLGNYVWVDQNGNGQQDEPPSAGLDSVTVTLTDVDRNTTISTTVNGGYYTFTNLLPNTQYTVTFTLPAGYSFTTPNNSGSTAANDSDAPPNGVVVVTTGTTDDYTIDAGLVQALNLGNYVWFDTDKQGDQDANERGIADAVVALYKADGVTPATDLNGDPVPTQTTDNTGLYNFTNLLPGGYVVKITMPSGYAPTVNQVGNPNTDNDTDSNIASNVGQVYSSGVVTLTVAGEPGSAIDGDGANGNLTVDFGFIGVNLGNYVWVDQNGNGEQDEPTSAGLNGVTVTLTLPGGVVTTTTVNGGYYTFTNLLPNTIYTVTFSTPAGYLPTQANSGNDGADSDPVNGRVQILLGTQDDLTIDAGFVRLASIGDRVWSDHNRNGLQDSGENGVANVTVELLNSSSAVISTTTTGAGGYYSFTNLAPGDYRIHFVLTTLPADTVVTRPNGGAADADSDADPITGMTAFTTLSPAESDPTWDLGIYLPPAAIGDRVWLDTNRNGVQEDGEPGLANVTVNLLDSSGAVISTTTTNASGYYSFTNRVPADYAVQVVRPDGYLPSPTGQGNDDVDSDIDPTTGRMPTTTLTPNEYDATWDAGFYPVVNLGNLVWHDRDNNGQVDSGEAGISNVTVQLFREGDEPTTATPVATDTTDGNGNYLFANLAPGRYFVYIPAPPVSYPWSSTVTDSRDNGEDNDDNGAQSAHGSNPWGPVMSPVIELTTNGEPINDGDDAQGDLTVDFGFFAPASLGDLVWLDSDKDGVQDQDETGVSGTADERGVPGVLVTLYSSVTNSVVATTTTDTHGRYLFDNLLPGDYFVEFALPTGYSLSPVDQGGNDAFDSDVNPTTLRTPVTVLTSGEHDPTLDMGLYLPTEPASIGDTVWFDTDADGVQDSGETGVPGVSVTLYRADGAVVATTTTDVNGEYEFNSLPPGDYSVAFTPSIGYLISPQDVGGDETTDSDVDTNTGYTPVTTLTAGENDPTWDLGLYLPTEPASIGDTVWFDTDADGVQDSGETGVPGVLVTLYRADGTPLATTHTDPDGHYQFANLAPGDYFVEFDPLTGYVGTLADQGADDAVDSDANPNTGRTPVTTLSAGENDPTWDYGVYAVDVLGVNLLAPATIGDRIWIDSNKNGLQDGGEANAPGVTVKLYTAAGELLAVDITDANGNYSFPNLLPGDYYVEVLLPTGYSYSPVSTTPGNDTDSNADPATGRTPVVTLPSGVTDPSWDTGIFITPTGEVEDTEPTLSYRVFLPQVAR